MANTARLGVVLGLNSAEFVAGIEAAKKKTNELGSQFSKIKTGLTVVGAAFVATTGKLLQFADQINDTADAYDVSVRGILDISKALEKAGGAYDNAGKLLGHFSNKVEEAASGSKQAQESFAKIGVSLEDLSKLSQEDLLKKVVDNIASIEDPITRTAKAVELLGKAGRGVDIKRLSEELNNGSKATDSQVAAIQQLSNYMEKLEGIITQVKLKLSEALLPVLKLIDIQFRDLGPLVEGVAFIIEKAFAGAVFSVTALVEAVKWAVSSVKNVANFLTPFSGSDIVADTKANNQRFLDNIREVQNALKGETPVKKDNKFGGREVTPYVDKGDLSKQNQLLKELKVIEQISDSYKTQLKYQQEGIQLQTTKLGLTQNAAEIAQLEYDIEKKRAEQIAQLEDKIGVARETKADQKVIDALQAQIDKVNELTNAYKQQIVDAEIANQNATQSFLGGWQEAFQKYQFMAIDNAAIVTESINGLFNGLTNGLTAFVTTGKLQFADFARAIIADLIRIQIQAFAAKIFGAALGAITGAYTPGVSADPAFAGPPAPRAEGGSIDAGMPYLVGERGPELIVPNRSGTVIPNGSLGQMGGTTNITNNYINAIDTKSFEDRLYQSSNAVWSANQYATKNISNSRTRS